MSQQHPLSQVQKLCETFLAKLGVSAFIILGWHEEGRLNYVYATRGMLKNDVVKAMTWVMHDYTLRSLVKQGEKKNDSSTLLTLCKNLLSEIDLPGFVVLCLPKKGEGYRALYATRKISHMAVLSGISWSLRRYVEKKLT